ncbi:YbeF family transcriptional regulator [Dryocola clanedunensis]|uniref:YbeF family transcriptional regulator n=1 Tax=Cedecea sulfonylureivorans TaxID=3051154 RepID=UPI001926978E|nr:YbeF family transcriptional regulator [Cedecea sulfonylureivorans]
MGIPPTSENKVMDRDDKNNHPVFKTLRNVDLNLLTIFEAVYVHKGIVNAAKVLNLTPSAISQSIQKLRLIFPDPLFIRKGQGVAPTAYAAHLHEYISQGLESILSALDINNSFGKQRTITIATQPTVGALLIPKIYSVIQRVNSRLLIRNIPIVDGESQLAQFQTDMLIDVNHHSGRSIATQKLFEDRIIAVCRKDHPVLQSHQTLEDMRAAEHTFLILQDDLLRDIRQLISELFPQRQITFGSYNFVTVASVLGSSDLIGFMPYRLFEMFSATFGLREIQSTIFTTASIDYNLHFNKLSMRDIVLQEVIDAVRSEFQTS